jgi:ATP-dependent RNA helicase DDX18/HAS1
MVCTDRASRGCEFGGQGSPVGHVVLFDWPRDPAEFLRRVGRTARGGKEGRCTALVIGSQVKREGG